MVNGLEITVVALGAGCQRREAEALEALRDVGRGGIKAAAAGTAPFTRGIRQPFDVGAHALGVELRLELGQRRTGRQFDRLRLRCQVAPKRGVADRPLAGRFIGGLVAGKHQPGIFAVMGQFARQRIGCSHARRRDIEDHRIGVIGMAHAGDQAASRGFIRRIGGAQSAGVERSPIGLEPLRHDGREFIARTEHPHGAIRRQGIDLAIQHRLDTLALLPPGLGKTRIEGCAVGAHHDQRLFGTKSLRQRGRCFERAKPAIDRELRIDLDALRAPLEVETHVNARPVGRHRNGFGLNALIGRDHHRNIQRKPAPGLHLR